MRISIFAQVEGDDSGPGRMVPIGTIERDSLSDPASGMGLWFQEAQELLEHNQTVVLDEQADRFVRPAAHRLACPGPLGIKDTKSVELYSNEAGIPWKGVAIQESARQAALVPTTV